MRPSLIFALTIAFIISVDTMLLFSLSGKTDLDIWKKDILTTTVAALGLSDLCVSTEARYTRHPAVSDKVVPFMDHPGAIEHFPSGSFFAVVP